MVRALSALAGGTVALRITSEPWRSGLFSGERHIVEADFRGFDAKVVARRFASEAESYEFKLDGCLVADIAVSGDLASGGGARLQIEVLTVDAS